MKKFYLLISFTILLIFIPGCTHTLPLTERPCSQNITVINNEKSGDHYLISTTVTLIEKNEKENRSLSLYFQKFTNKYLLSFIYSSFGSNPPGLTGVNLEFNDGTVTRFKDPVYIKEMNENSSDKYTITYFEMDANDLSNLCQKNLKNISINFGPESHSPGTEAELDAETSSAIKYLANCIADTGSK